MLRDDKTLEIEATLGKLVTPATQQRDMLNATGVGMSGRHDDFPVVLQHDTVLRPADCGSPLVALDGKVVGMNVARGGRTETYCVPANALILLMYDLMSGRLHPPEPTKKPESRKTGGGARTGKETGSRRRSPRPAGRREETGSEA